MSTRAKTLAANLASLSESSLRRIFFQRMFAHSAISRSGAARARLRSASASLVPSSSMTHLMAILASMTRGLPVRPVPHATGARRVYAAGLGRAAVARRPALQAQNEIVVEIANAEAAWHRAFR